MRALTKPEPEHVYDPQSEIHNLIQHRDAVPANVARNRNIPAVAQPGKLLLASWDIAHYGCSSSYENRGLPPVLALFLIDV